MAATRAGLIDFSCSRCQEAPYIKDQMGCKKPLEIAAKWLEDEEEFFNCPMQFITVGTCDFLEKYDCYKKGTATPPDYERQSANFITAAGLLERSIDKFLKLKKGE